MDEELEQWVGTDPDNYSPSDEEELEQKFRQALEDIGVLEDWDRWKATPPEDKGPSAYDVAAAAQQKIIDELDA